MSMHFEPPVAQAQFDIIEWYHKFQSCHRYFVDHAQHSGPVQMVATFVNIQLPAQRSSSPPVLQSPSYTHSGVSPPAAGPSSTRPGSKSPLSGTAATSLIPYIRRLVVTGFDSPAVLHGFFGDDWVQGIGSIHETERRNYLFAAKSDTWARVKAQYDMEDGQTVPFLRPLHNVTEEEIQGAESNWSEWLAMQDWMLGPRAPSDVDQDQVRIKTEQE